ncbi:hypothetical protein F5B22DRAFT_646506 [Xylaria bambusicola]|uniref:uncharacterized protein n=1 Tax=Xylaria bambusicola TaxID=326684 RepID=UPI0020083900|nr:uncharacterized protein F5B22DRAFT_646506 [Xylaria bambusicola]KAI0516767.1 hypothetical protein F5B22DRAFT_646506 [Xylaria bambusicola]
MKFALPFLLALAPGAAMAAPKGAPKKLEARSGGFYESCPENNLYYSTLNSKCKGTWTSIDLNHVIGNRQGNLVWSAGFFYSCGNISKPGTQCSLQYDNLSCYCSASDGTVYWTSISLNTHLAYENGKLFYN